MYLFKLNLKLFTRNTQVFKTFSSIKTWRNANLNFQVK